MTRFVHLNVHSEYSIRDGLIKIPDLVERTVASLVPAVALTDLGNLFGLVKFYQVCLQQGIKPLIGADITLTQPGEGNAASRCTLLAANNQGYRNLIELISRAYVPPRDAPAPQRGCINVGWLEELNGGLIVLSGAVRGDIGTALLRGDLTRAEALARRWQHIFGDRFYLELQRTGRDEEGIYIPSAVALAGKLGLPVVATNDVRFLDEDDFEAHEARVCIYSGRTLDDPRRVRRYSAQQYLRSADEMADLFSDIPQALQNSWEIARRCNVSIELGTYHLPQYPIPEGFTLESYLAHAARSGLEKRLHKVVPASRDCERTPVLPDRARYYERLDYELGIINQMGFPGYFLIVMEFIRWAKDQDIPVGPGRGSGAGSLVAYALEITDLDPLKYDLLFERFLNPERVSMPDFDVDFCMEGRDRVIAHVSDLYGQDAVCQIITFGTMAAKAVVRDVARVQGKPYGLADKLSKLIPFEVGMTLGKAEQQSQELRDFIADNDEASEIMDMAYRLEGIVRNVGKHAGGVVIAPSRLADYVPLYVDDGGGGLMSQFDKDDVERTGLVKFDFLGLKTLTIIRWTVDALNATRPDDPLDISALPLDDPAVYELLKSARTTAVFQLESRGIRELLLRQLPDSFEDIVALVALYRPGPLQSGMVDDFVDRKHGRAEVEYPHPALAAVLENTYGVILYQEQVMQIAQVLAGFSLGQADVLRSAMGKKKVAEMARQRSLFSGGAVKNGVDEALANAIFDLMEKFAGYGFNKSHSVAYALVAYQTAWLKAHYPTYFMAAVLSADMQHTDKIVTLVDDIHTMGLVLQPPDVNRGVFRFSVTAGKIDYGLGAVKGVGEGPVAALVAARNSAGPFADLQDFCNRVDPHSLNKRVLEALIRSGAMDGFFPPDKDPGSARAVLLSQLDDAVRSAEQAARDTSIGMSDMFGELNSADVRSAGRQTRPLTFKERLEGERDTLGLYLSGHPIDEYLEEIRHFCAVPIAQLREGKTKRRVTGLVVSMRVTRNKRGEMMAFLVLDDRSGRIEASVYGRVFAENRHKIARDAILVLEGEVQPDDFTGALKMRVDSVITLDEARVKYASWLQINVSCEQLNGNFSGRLQDLLTPHCRAERPRESALECPVVIQYQTPDARACIRLGERWRVHPSDQLLLELRAEFGSDKVVLSYPQS